MPVLALHAGLPKVLISCRLNKPRSLGFAEDAAYLRRCVTQLVSDTAGATQHIIDLPGDRTRQLLFQETGDRSYSGACLVFRNTRLLSDAFDEDRKSTRLNSSHGYISYAVFCLK